MKRHQVMDLFYGSYKKVEDGEWKDAKQHPERRCKVLAKLKNGNDTAEVFAYFYPDKCAIPSASIHMYFCSCKDHLPLDEFITHWKYILEE